MNEEELGPLNIRSVGLRGARAPTVPTSLSASARVYKPRLEGDQKRDPLDTIIDKMEDIRPECPVKTIEDNWVKFTDWFVDITPPIKVLPPKEEAGLEAELKYEIPRGVTYPALIPEFNRGDTVKATLTITNTGTVTAKNVVGSVIVKTPVGASWLTISFSKRDIAPGSSVPVTGTKTIASTDPLGTYTNSGSISCDNAPTAPISGSAFDVTEVVGTTLTVVATPVKVEYRRGEIATVYVYVKNTGSVAATGVMASLYVYDSIGIIWGSWPNMTLPDLTPGITKSVGCNKPIATTDRLGQYTYRAIAWASNAPEVTKDGSVFKVVEAGTTLAATMGYTKA